MRKKHSLIILLLIFVCFDALSKQNIDSLIQISETLSGNKLVDVYNTISNELEYTNPQKSLVFAKKAKEISYKNLYYKGIANSFKNIGDAYYHLNELDKSTEFLSKSKPYFKQINSIKDIADVNVCIGINYDLKSEYDKALKYYQLAYKQYNNINDKDGLSYVLHNQGVIYFEQKNYKKAIEYFLSDLKNTEETTNKRYLASSYQQIFTCYKNLNELDKAIKYNKKFNEIANELNDFELLGTSHSNFGNLYKKNKNYKKALKSHIKSLNYFKKTTNYFKILSEEINISGVYIILGNYDKAIQIADSTYLKSTKYNFPYITLMAVKILKDAYLHKKNYEKALFYQDKYQELKDTLNTQQYIKEITKLQTKYDLNKKNNEIKLLNKTKELNELKLTKAKENQRYLIILIILFLLLLVFIMQRYRYRTRINKILDQKNQRLNILNTTKDKFFSIIAHDLKNPLSSFNTLIDLIVENFENLSSDDIKNYLIDINKSSKNLKDLLNNLLLWARSQTNRIEINKQNFNIAESVNDAVKQLEYNLKLKNIDFETNIKDANIYADKNMITTVIRNLLSNAIKFTNNGKSIEIFNKISDNKIILTVKDSGVGIPDDKLKNLFKLDINQSTKGTNNETGTGLGLILCKEFTEKNGGNISVKSTKDKGSEFSIVFPVAD